MAEPQELPAQLLQDLLLWPAVPEALRATAACRAWRLQGFHQRLYGFHLLGDCEARSRWYRR